MTIQTAEYTLPTHWASYFVNDDCTGMEDSEIADADGWWYSTFEFGNTVACVDVKDDNDFCSYHDARSFVNRCGETTTVLPCDCSTFVFIVHG